MYFSWPAVVFSLPISGSPKAAPRPHTLTCHESLVRHYLTAFRPPFAATQKESAPGQVPSCIVISDSDDSDGVARATPAMLAGVDAAAADADAGSERGGARRAAGVV